MQFRNLRRGNMRFINLPTLALLITGCGSQSATVGERFDDVEAESSAPGTTPPKSDAPDAAPPASDSANGTAAATTTTSGPTGTTTTFENTTGASGGTGDTGTTGTPAPTSTTLPPLVAPAVQCADDTVIALPASEVAQRLSAWIGAEDQELLDAAANDQLSTLGQVECHARRLVQLPEHRVELRRFLDEWLGIEARVADANSDLSAELNAQMVAETDAFLDAVANASAPTLSALLSGNARLLGPELAAHYGVEFPEGETSAIVDVPEQHGVLTLGLLNSTNGRISGRGAWIETRFACVPVGAPVPEAASFIPPTASGTYRERLGAVVTEPACAGCHTYIDGPGYTLERFDALGRPQTEDSGEPIDESGSINLRVGNPVAVSDVADLSTTLASIEPVRECLSMQILWQAINPAGDETLPADYRKAAALLLDEELDLRTLFVAATQSTAFWE